MLFLRNKSRLSLCVCCANVCVCVDMVECVGSEFHC